MHTAATDESEKKVWTTQALRPGTSQWTLRLQTAQLFATALNLHDALWVAKRR